MTAGEAGNWQHLSLTSEGGAVIALVMDPSDPAVLYAGTDEGLFKSTDGAATWTPLSVGGRINMIAVDPALRPPCMSPPTRPSTSLSTVGPPGRGSATARVPGWVHDNSGSTPPRLLPRSTGRQGYGYGPFKSTDGGSTWEVLSHPRNAMPLPGDRSVRPHDLREYPRRGSTLVRSSDRGATWEDVSAGHPCRHGVEIIAS